MATVEDVPARLVPLENVSNDNPAPEDDPKAALAKGVPLDDENEEQILFSCNICYDVSTFGVIIMFYYVPVGKGSVCLLICSLAVKSCAC